MFSPFVTGHACMCICGCVLHYLAVWFTMIDPKDEQDISDTLSSSRLHSLLTLLDPLNVYIFSRAPQQTLILYKLLTR